MSDVPTLALALVALACYGRAFAGRSPGWLLLGLGAATSAVVTRQTAVAAPVAAALALWRFPALRRRVLWIFAVVLPIAIGVATHLWFENRPDVIRTESRIPSQEIALSYLYALLHLCGLAALPVLALDLRPKNWTGERIAGAAHSPAAVKPVVALGAVILLSALMGAAAIYWYRYPSLVMYDRGLFPYLDGIITPFGVYMGQPGKPVLLNSDLRIALTVLGCIGAGALCWRLLVFVGRGRFPALLLSYTVLQIPLILFARYVFDRYLLSLLPGALAVAAIGQAEPSRRSVVGFVCLGIFAIASCCLEHDWLAWNAARWQLGRRAVAAGIDPRAIAGGFEWNGWWYRDGEAPAPRLQLSAQCTPGANVVDSEPFSQWLPPAKRRFFLFELLSSSNTP